MIWAGALALLGCWVFDGLWRRRVRLPQGLFVWSSLAFLAAAAVTTVTSTETSLAFWGEYERNAGLLGYGSYVAFAYATIVVFGSANVRVLIRAAIVGSTLPISYGLLQWLGADPWEWNDFAFTEVFSTFGNANLLAGYAAIIVPLGASHAFDRFSSIRWRVAGGAVAILAMMATIAAKSFQGPVAALAGLAVLVAASRWMVMDRRRQRLVYGGSMVVFATLVMLAGPIRSEVTDGLGERRHFWSAAIEMAMDRPVFGTGLDTFGQHFLESRPAAHARDFGDSHAESAHSVPLGMFASGGLLLGLTYLGVAVATALALIRGLRTQDRDRALLLAGLGGAWAAYHVQAAVSFDVPSHALLHWVLAALIIIVSGSGSVRELRLPGVAVVSVGRGRRARRVVRPSTWAGLAVSAVIAVGLLLTVLRPLRADVAAGTGFRAAAAGDVAGGLEALERATSLAPWRSRYWLLTGAVLEETRNYEAALRVMEQAARREPGSSEYAVFAARLASQVGQVRQAGDWYLKAIERNPRSRLVLEEAVTWAINHDEPWAVDVADKATRDIPDGTIPWLLLARAHAAAGEDAEARSAYEQVLNLDPANAEALTGTE